MRIFTGGLKTPFTMIGEGVYRVKASRDPDYPKGEIICAKLGWVKSAIIRVIISNLSKHPCDLQQNGTPEETLYSGTIHHALSGGSEVSFVPTVNL